MKNWNFQTLYFILKNSKIWSRTICKSFTENIYEISEKCYIFFEITIKLLFSKFLKFYIVLKMYFLKRMSKINTFCKESLQNHSTFQNIGEKWIFLCFLENIELQKAGKLSLFQIIYSLIISVILIMKFSKKFFFFKKNVPRISFQIKNV